MPTPQPPEMDIERLKLSRRAHRGLVTKHLHSADEYLSKVEPTQEDLKALRLTSEILDTKVKRLCQLDTDIFALTKTEDIEAHIVEQDDYMTALTIKIAAITNYYLEHSPPPPSQSPSVSQPYAKSRNVSLPKLTLTKFEGNILQWISFYDGFRAAVDKDTTLDGVQKFQYLRAHLTGEAARTIEGLSLTTENYSHAMDLLTERYGQPQRIINAYMRALWELPRPSGTLQSLRSFYDQLESYIRGLNALGKTEDTYGELLVPLILDKVPAPTRQQITRMHGNTEWSLQQLRTALLQEIETLRAGELCGQSASNQHESTFPRQDSSRTHATTAAFHTDSRPPRPPKACVFCKGQHSPATCLKITNRDKRLDVVNRDKLCFNCLGSHKVQDCRSKFKCRHCQRKHHSSLCTNADVLDPEQTTQRPPAQSRPQVHANTVSAGNSNIPTKGTVLLKTAVADLSSGSHTDTGTILFDEGSTRSFITKDLAEKLQLLPEGSETIKIAAFGDKTPRIRYLDTTTVSITTLSGEQQAITALIVPTISANLKQAADISVLTLPHLQGLRLAHATSRDDDFGISVLIGADYYWDFVQDKVIRGPGPTAVKSSLGYLLSGPTQNNRAHDTTVFHIVTNVKDEEVQLESYWDLETIGIQDKHTTTSQKASRFDTYPQTHLHLEKERYTAKLPWKEDHSPLPTNYYISDKRTRSMAQRLPPAVREVYDNIITEQVERGFIEPVTEDDPDTGHYLPHHPVQKDSETTPIRIVYDCSCKTGNNPSLNDCLETGTPMLNDLTSILLRFRMHNYGISTDIEKAFLQIGLDTRDQNFTKFLWLSDWKDPNSPFSVYRFKTVLFGAVCSPFILNTTVKSHLEQQDSEITSDLKQNIYVDNILTGVHNSEDSIKCYNEANAAMKSGGFHLRAWSTNCPELDTITKDAGTAAASDTVNTLGLQWDTKKDKLLYPAKKLNNARYMITKREVVQATSSLYDPLGFLSPVHIKAKIFIQDLWKQTLAWDEPLQEQDRLTWSTIVDDLQMATEMCTIQRQYCVCQDQSTRDPYELHVFSDSSTRAYGTVAYLRRGPNTSIVMAKTRVAPVKTMTVPRLELMAVLLASRLADYVTHSLSSSLQIERTIIWTDSQIVLHWLASDKTLPCFVANRVKEIKSLPVTEFKYCPTKDNPADVITRGVSVNHFLLDQQWWQGPSWLSMGDWPVCKLFDSVLHVTSDEKSDDSPSAALPDDTPSHQETFQPAISVIVNPEHFNSYTRLLRVTALVQRFITNAKITALERNRGPLTANEIHNAETLWIRHTQREHYSTEIHALKTEKKSLGPLTRQLRLFIDDNGLIRVGGRLHNAPIGFASKFPILLPRRSRFTEILTTHAHESVMHSGVQATVTSIRHRFWITQIRPLVKRLLSKCVTCRKVSGKPYRQPIPAPLQKDRLLKAPPFTVTGVDFTGALYVQDGHSEHKAYICLFTCAVSRAVHLELVMDLSTSTFLRAFRRFVARRSLPQTMISDNGSTYLSAAKELQQLFDSPSIQLYLANRRVKWKFIPKRAPWFGGFWERLIGITKTTLKKVLGRSFVTSDELYTILAEIEATINDRPLTYITTDSDDLPPLTPSHLVHGRCLTTLPYMCVDEDELNDPTFGTSSDLTKRCEHLNKIHIHFWKRWSKEYLSALREQDRIGGHGTLQNTISTGDIVLVENKSVPRLQWRLAIVEDVITGNDGLIRAVNIKTDTGRTSRPITKLYPLEINSGHQCQTVADPELPPCAPVTRQASSRKAACYARHKIKSLATDTL